MLLRDTRTIIPDPDSEIACFVSCVLHFLACDIHFAAILAVFDAILEEILEDLHQLVPVLPPPSDWSRSQTC